MPLILPIAAITCGALRLCFRYVLLYTARITVDTGGRLYFRAIFDLYWGIITMELTILGLFLLKIDPSSLRDDLGQISILLLTIFCTVQYQQSIKSFYKPLIRHDEAVRCEGLAPLSNVTEQYSQPDVGQKYRTTTRTVKECYTLEGRDLEIWLPKDVDGVSDALMESVRRNYIGPSSNAQIGLTNAGAAMTSNGDVILQNDDNR